MNALIPINPSLPEWLSLPELSASHECRLGPATLTVTDTALIVAVGPSRLILTAEGIRLDAPRIDLNLENDSPAP